MSTLGARPTLIHLASGNGMVEHRETFSCAQARNQSASAFPVGPATVSKVRRDEAHRSFVRGCVYAGKHLCGVCGASRGKHHTRACFEFERRLAYHLDMLRGLTSGRYRPRPYFRFVVKEPKERVIYAPAFRDLVVQHAIYRVILPIFDPTFIAASFACRVGYGTHRAADYAQQALKASPRDSYTLKLDARKFFYSIDRAVLRTLIERKIKDRRFIGVMMQFADYGSPVGIPIGNLLSQIYALIYLNPVDHFVKRELGVKRYCRYVDDLMLFGLTREQCVEYRERIAAFMRDRLGWSFRAPRSRPYSAASTSSDTVPGRASDSFASTAFIRCADPLRVESSTPSSRCSGTPGARTVCDT